MIHNSFKERLFSSRNQNAREHEEQQKEIQACNLAKGRGPLSSTCSSLEQVRAVTASEQYVPQRRSTSTAPFTLFMSPTCHILPEGAFIFARDPEGAFVSTVIIIVAQVTHLYLILGKVNHSSATVFSTLLFLSQGISYFWKVSCFLFQTLLLKPSQMNLCGVRQRC